MAEVNEINGSWKAELLAAGVRQGPSFLLLVVLLWGLWQFGRYVVTEGVPAHLEQIKAGYRELQAAHDRDLTRVVTAFDHEQDRYKSIIGALEQLIENRALLQENRDLLLRLIQQLKDLHPTSDKPKG